MKSCVLLVLAVTSIGALTVADNSSAYSSNESAAGNGTGDSEPADGGNANSSTGVLNGTAAANANNSSSSPGNVTKSNPFSEAVVVEATVGMTMSEAHATSVVDAFEASGTRNKVAMALKKAFATCMAGVEAAHIEITSIKGAAHRLLAAATGEAELLRRLNSTNITGTTGTNVTIAVAFQITLPEGKSGMDIVNLAIGMDTAVLKTSVETYLASEADLTVVVSTVWTPTAAVKVRSSTGSVVSGAFLVVLPSMRLLLGILVSLSAGIFF